MVPPTPAVNIWVGFNEAEITWPHVSKWVELGEGLTVVNKGGVRGGTYCYKGRVRGGTDCYKGRVRGGTYCCQ